MTTLQQQADELGKIQARLAPFRPDIDREKALKEAFRNAYALAPGDKTFLVEGEEYVVSLGEMANERTIANKNKLIKLLTAAVFRQIATVTWKALEQQLSKLQLATVTNWARTGTRPLNVVPKGK